jgi:hypothetical protein
MRALVSLTNNILLRRTMIGHISNSIGYVTCNRVSLQLDDEEGIYEP